MEFSRVKKQCLDRQQTDINTIYEILVLDQRSCRSVYNCWSRCLLTTTQMPNQHNNWGIFDLDTDSNGRWSVERFKGLMFQVERDANVIAQRTRRGKGNIIICSSDVASALQMDGVLDYTPALNNNLNVDDTGNTFAGVLNGKYKVYIDPYAANLASNASPSKQYMLLVTSTSLTMLMFLLCILNGRAVGQDHSNQKLVQN